MTHSLMVKLVSWDHEFLSTAVADTDRPTVAQSVGICGASSDKMHHSALYSPIAVRRISAGVARDMLGTRAPYAEGVVPPACCGSHSGR